MTAGDDQARLLAALVLASRSAGSSAHPGETFDDRLARLGDAMRGRHWQITVARDLKLSALAWIDRPWHCWTLRKLVRELLSETVHPNAEVESVKLLTRCAAMVEFGVDVNERWYRRLREAVVSGRASARELRSLLRKVTVWWGASAGRQASGRRGIFARIWTMGRPTDGELSVVDHHWTTKSLLLALLLFSGLALGFVGVGLVRHVAAHGIGQATRGLLVACYTYAILFWATWWFGPSSWAAVRRLQEVLDLQDDMK